MDAYVGLGSNLGDRVGNLVSALLRVDALESTMVARVSHAYETEPWGGQDQPPFVNAVALVRTDLPADTLLVWLKQTESEMGRTSGERCGPRVIDLDILLYGDEEWAAAEIEGVEGGLVIPHPRLAEREFVVRPLLEIAPDAALPDGTPVASLLESAREGRIIGDMGELPGREAPYEPASAQEPRPGEDELERAERIVHDAADAFVDLRWDSDEEWVPVAIVWGGQRLDRTPVMDLTYVYAAMRAERVPVVWHPHDPSDGTNPWGIAETVSLAVPRRFAEQGRAIVADLAPRWLAAEGAPLPSGGAREDGSFIVPQVGGTVAFIQALRRGAGGSAGWILVILVLSYLLSMVLRGSK